TCLEFRRVLFRSFSFKISSEVSVGMSSVHGAYSVALPWLMVSTILPHTRVFGRSIATMLAFHFASQVKGPASDAAPNSTVVRAERSNHSGCTTHSRKALA